MLNLPPRTPHNLATFAVVAVMLPTLAPLGVCAPPAGSRELLDRIWRGVSEAELRHASGCGSLTERRTSALLAKPLVMRGRFCAAGLDRFRVEYDGPQSASVVYNRGTLNVSTDGGRHIEILEVGRAVRRAQRYFSGSKSSENLERDFLITATEAADHYALLLLPVSGRVAGRVKKVAVELRKLDFLPRRIEIEGKSGVRTVFEIEVEKVDAPIEERQFDVHRAP